MIMSYEASFICMWHYFGQLMIFLCTVIFLGGVQKDIKHAQLVTMILHRTIFMERFISLTIDISCRMIIDGGEVLSSTASMNDVPNQGFDLQIIF